MTKDVFTSVSVLIVGIIGYSLTLMQIYSSPDGNSYPFNGSLIYLGTSIFMLVFLFTRKLEINKILKWLNYIMIVVFSINALLLALICIYASPTVDKIYPLESAIFTMSGMIALSSIFLINKSK